MEIITGAGEKEICSKVKETVEKLDRARNEIKRQWLVNVMFLYGKHHFMVSKRYGTGEEMLSQRIAWEIESLRKANTVRRTSNYILPLFRSLYSRLIRMKANVHAEPTTSTERDRDAARVSKEVAEDFMQNCNRNNPWLSEKYSGMQSVLMKLVLYKLTLGTAYLVPYFNPKAQSLVYDRTRNDVISADVGEAEVRVSSVLDVFRDPFGRHIIERRFMSPEQAEYEFGVRISPEKVDEDTIQDKISRLLDGEQNDKELTEGCYVYHKYCTPTVEYPKGQMIICTGNQVISEGEMPPEYKLRLPPIEFRYQDLGFSQFAQGAIEQVVDLQQDYNFTLTRIAHIKKNLTGKILAPRGSKLSAKWDDEVGQILYYAMGAKPEYLAPGIVPDYMYKEIARIREDMENLMNSHDSSMGRTPGQVKCVTPDTECLTKDGFKKYYEVKEGQEIYTVNPETLKAEWKPIRKLFVYEGYCGDMFKISGRNISATVTPNHKWLVKEQFGSDNRQHSLIETDKLKTSNQIMLCALPKDDRISPFSDEFVELVGWVITEGTYGSGNEIVISQSMRANPKKCGRIREIVSNLYGVDKAIKNYKTDSIRVRFAKELGAEIKKLLPKKELTYEFINLLNNRQLKILRNALIAGDGNIRNDVQERFFTVKKNDAEIFVYLCILIGDRARLCKQFRSKKGANLQDYYEVNVKKSKYCSPLNAKNRDRKNPCRFDRISYSGIVWCPNTENGTFFARKDGQVYVTGNSGVGISNLAEVDNSMISPELMQFERKMGYFFETELDIIQDKYSERRILQTTGDNMAYEIKSFVGSDLFGQKKIVVKMGSNLPLDPNERRAYIMGMKKEQMISPDKAKELLEFEDIEGIYTGLDETGAKNDILNTIEGNTVVIAEPWEDHTIHLKVLNDFRKGSIYARLQPEIRQRIDYLAQQHQEMLLNEQQVAAGMGGGMPPAAQPQNGGIK